MPQNACATSCRSCVRGLTAQTAKLHACDVAMDQRHLPSTPMATPPVQGASNQPPAALHPPATAGASTALRAIMVVHS